MCISHVNSVRDHFSIDLAAEPLQRVSKHGYAPSQRRISDSTLENTATEMTAFWYFIQNQPFVENATPVFS